MKQELLAFFREEDGVTAIEYGLIAGLIAVVLLGAFSNLGEKLTGLFNDITGALPVVGSSGGAGGGT